MNARTQIRLAKLIIWLGALTPAGLLVWWAFHDGLGANPIEKLTHWTGYTALVLLLVTLAVTPLRRLSGWNRAVQLRRLVGLFAFFYAAVHLLIYAVLDQGLALTYVGEDVMERPYITVGFGAFVLLLPLALTSTRGWIRRLGRRWQLLHRLIYPATLLGILHFLWLVKADTREPLILGGIFAALMLARLPALGGRRSPAGARSSRDTPPRSPAAAARSLVSDPNS